MESGERRQLKIFRAPMRAGKPKSNEVTKMETLKVKLTGIAPIMMHNGQLADPTNKWTIELKRLTGLKKKTEEDLLEIRRVEWFGGLYLDDKNQVVLPSENVLAAVGGGARKSKDGKEAAAGVFAEQPWFRLSYNGPKNIEQLYEDARFVDYRSVVIGGKRVMRARPIFREWEVSVALTINTDLIDKSKVMKALEMCGERVGILEHRPRYGRFTVGKA